MSRWSPARRKAAASSQRLFEILDRPPGVPEPAHPVHPDQIHGAIEVRNASFRFGSRQVIDDVSLDVKPGEMIGLVGTTGAGKSTLVNLVCRFYDVSEGAVLVDGTDIRSFPIAEYRRHIGIVLQDPFLFWGTIAENIAYGKPNAPALKSWARRGPRGRTNSSCSCPTATIHGGASAATPCRAGAPAHLHRTRPAHRSEHSHSRTKRPRRWTRKLNARSRRRSTTWYAAAPPSQFAHRLSTLHKADRLVVLEHGRIVEVGQHPDLLAAGGRYAQLYRAQTQLGKELGSPEPPRVLLPALPEREEGDA